MVGIWDPREAFIESRAVCQVISVNAHLVSSTVRNESKDMDGIRGMRGSTGGSSPGGANPKSCGRRSKLTLAGRGGLPAPGGSSRRPASVLMKGLSAGRCGLSEDTGTACACPYAARLPYLTAALLQDGASKCQDPDK